MRRFTRVSLKTLLILITVFSLGLGFHVHGTRMQREAVKVIQEHGGWVAYDYQLVDFEYDHKAKSWVPAWLRQPLGDDFFHSIEEVSFWSRYRDGAQEVRQDPATLPLSDLLAGVPNIKCLRLWGTQVTDNNLVAVAELSSLEQLVMVEAVNVSDEGVANLRTLKRLEWLVVTKSQMSDVSLQVLSELPNLKVLNLKASLLSDEGISYFSKHKELRMLHVHGRDDKPSDITDKGIAQLCNVPNLVFIGAKNTLVTESGASDFMGKCPNCKVLR